MLMPPTLPMVLFGGPSLSELALQRCRELGIELRPPARRNDIQQLVETGYRGTIALVDGVFHQVISVGHKELLGAIAAGCEVYGISSMGAIRAYELRTFGMKGIGKVYRYFDQEGDFQDDEVALIHNPTPPYHPFSEPLVHIRVCITDLCTRQEITPKAGQEIIDQLKALYFGERTLETFARLLESASGKAFGDLVPDMAPYRIKQRDVEDFLTNITMHS
jgi:hypothetical protein